MNRVEKITFRPAGDGAVWIRFGDPASNQVNFETNMQVHALAEAVIGRGWAEIGEVVPGYAALVIYYDPLALSYEQMEMRLRDLLEQGSVWEERAGQVIEIPVVYGGEYGPDLGFVARHNGLSEEEVIAIHCSGVYPVYMMGFTPGFPYLGGMDARIAAPRLENPRSQVPEGSVGIAGQQTGIYPIESPGGWRIIGRTPLRLFDPEGTSPFLLSPGDRVRFVRAG